MYFKDGVKNGLLAVSKRHQYDIYHMCSVHWGGDHLVFDTCNMLTMSAGRLPFAIKKSATSGFVLERNGNAPDGREIYKIAKFDGN